jgi:O-antigen ligase
MTTKGLTERFPAPRAALVPLGVVVVAPVLAKAIVMQPVFGAILCVAAVGVFLATRSLAYPLGLAGFPTIVIAFSGSNPFPRGVAPLLVFGWLVLAAVAALVLRPKEISPRLLTAAPVTISVVLFGYMLLRLAASTSPAYGNFKVELFFLYNLTLLAGGILLARRTEDLELFLVLQLVIDGISGFLLLAGIGVDPSLPANRQTLTGENVIALGIQGAQGLVIAMYLVLYGSRHWMRVFAGCMLPLSAVAWLASGSRGPVIGGLLGTLTLLILVSGTRARLSRVLLLGAILVAAGAIVDQAVPKQPLQRSLSILTANEHGTSSNGRADLWSAAYNGFRGHPLVGEGTGSFAKMAKPQACTGPGCLDPYPHNILLESAVELGIIGLGLVLAFLIVSARRVVGVVRNPLTRAPGSIVAALFVSGVVNSLLTGDISGNGDLWLAAGLAVGLGSVVRRGDQTSSTAS